MKKVALVTGGNRGIGRATVRALAKAGYAVAINYHTHEAEARQLAGEIVSAGGQAFAVGADVADADAVARMYEQVKGELGAVSVFIHNAGIAQQKLFSDITEADWDRMFDIHVKGAYHCMKRLLPDMIHEKYGRIVTISSIWGMVGASCEVHYSASKAALIGMTKALAKELGPSGITVNCVAPGVINTEMNEMLSPETLAALCEETPLGCVGSAEQIASAVCYLCSEDAAFLTGQVLSPNGGLVI